MRENLDSIAFKCLRISYFDGVTRKIIGWNIGSDKCLLPWRPVELRGGYGVSVLGNLFPTQPRENYLVFHSHLNIITCLNDENFGRCVVTSARNLVRAAVSVMRIKGARSIGIIYDSVSPFAADACRAQRQSLSEQGLTVVGMCVPDTNKPETGSQKPKPSARHVSPRSPSPNILDFSQIKHFSYFISSRNII